MPLTAHRHSPAGAHSATGALSSASETSGPERSAPQELAAVLGRVFSDPALLVQAVSHRSWCAETGTTASNERLEFLGDAVLGLVVAGHCYETYPELSEGALAKMRASVVNTAVLAEVGAELGLGRFLLLGRGEDSSGGREKPSILADTVEALIGALYLEAGWDPAQELVLRLLGERIATAAAGPGAGDYKTRLQEEVVRRVTSLPRYEVEGEGPDHARRYTARVYVAGRLLGTGGGRSKKDAEQAAAREAWDALAATEQQDLGVPERGGAGRGGAGGDA